MYVAGAGPVGLACAAACHLLGAAVVIVGDMIPERLEQARSFGCETIDLRKDGIAWAQIEQIVGVPEVDNAVDCVGFEARGHGHDAGVERPATVLNSLMEVTRAGGGVGIPGLYVTDDPGARGCKRQDRRARDPHRLGLGEVAYFRYRPMPGIAVQPPINAGHPLRQNSDRESGKRPTITLDEAPHGIQGFRQRRCKEVRDRSSQDGSRSIAAPDPASPSEVGSCHQSFRAKQYNIPYVRTYILSPAGANVALQPSFRSFTRITFQSAPGSMTTALPSSLTV